jgi:ABC-2 type transport system permease protein
MNVTSALRTGPGGTRLAGRLRTTLSTLPPRAAFGQLLRNEARLARRPPVAVVAGLGVPVLLLVVYGKVHAFHVPVPGAGGLTLFDSYEPVLVIFGLAMLTMWGIPGPLVTYRELGILRRLSTTPVPASWLLAAQALVQLSVAITGMAIVLIASVAAFGAPAPKSIPGVVVSCLLAIAGLFPLGLLIAALARTSGGASVIGRLLFVPLMFLAGLWVPRSLMPQLLADVSSYSPLGAATAAVQDALLTGFPPAAPLLVLAGYAVLLSLLARRLFRWE